MYAGRCAKNWVRRWNPISSSGLAIPPLAHRALEQEPDIGLLLPCNVVVRAEGKGSRVEVADPQAMLGIVGNEELNAVAMEAKQRLQRVVALLGGQS